MAAASYCERLKRSLQLLIPPLLDVIVVVGAGAPLQPKLTAAQLTKSGRQGKRT